MSVGRPRFYINCLEYLKTVGVPETFVPTINDRYYATNVSYPKFITLGTGFNDVIRLSDFNETAWSDVMQEKSFVAYLGHNFASADAFARLSKGGYEGDFHAPTSIGLNGFVNWELGQEGLTNAAHHKPEYDGWSLYTCNLSHFDLTEMSAQLRFESGEWNQEDPEPYNGLGGVELGCLMIGSFYDMPHSPQINVKLNREFGYAKEQIAYDGSSFSNTFEHSAPLWNGLGAWELLKPSDNSVYTQYPGGVPPPNAAKSGKRSWQLNFQLMKSQDLWGSNQHMSRTAWSTLSTGAGYDEDDFVSQSAYAYNILNDDNWFSQVWHKSLGGTIPMIFQADSNNFNSDQFSLVRLKSSTLKVAQSASSLFNISIVVEEIY